jgi:hypothetical protein
VHSDLPAFFPRLEVVSFGSADSRNVTVDDEEDKQWRRRSTKLVAHKFVDYCHANHEGTLGTTLETFLQIRHSRFFQKLSLTKEKSLAIEDFFVVLKAPTLLHIAMQEARIHSDSSYT